MGNYNLIVDKIIFLTFHYLMYFSPRRVFPGNLKIKFIVFDLQPC
nr:MAG TPA: hypothetical protein [Caudoviricetes sp.]